MTNSLKGLDNVFNSYFMLMNIVQNTDLCSIVIYVGVVYVYVVQMHLFILLLVYLIFVISKGRINPLSQQTWL